MFCRLLFVFVLGFFFLSSTNLTNLVEDALKLSPRQVISCFQNEDASFLTCLKVKSGSDSKPNLPP